MEVEVSAAPNHYWLCQLRSSGNSKESTEKSKIRLCFVIDNSGSMGSWTKRVTEQIGKGLWRGLSDNCELKPAILFLFDRGVSPPINLSSEEDFDTIKFPYQGSTNITLGVNTALNYLTAHPEPGVHNILVFLSDGEHTDGSRFDSSMAARHKAKLGELEMQLSIIVVGIQSSNTSLGTTIKSMETVPLQTMSTVYFADKEHQIVPLLADLVGGLQTSLIQGETVDVSLEQADDSVILSGNQSLKHGSLFVFNNQVSFVVKASQQPVFVVNGENLPVRQVAFDPVHVERIIEIMSVKLSQQRLVNGLPAIMASLSELEKLLDVARKMVEAPQNEEDWQNYCQNPVERRIALKKWRTRVVGYETERNRLLALKADIQNDSSAQASFLNGMQTGKYAHKAVANAGTLGQSSKQVLDAIARIWRTLPAINEKQYPEGVAPQSIMSLNSAAEHLAEWASILLQDDQIAADDLYSLLVAFGMVGYSVKFIHSSAAQMDPYQTRCTALEPFCVVDSSNVLLANKLGKKIRSPSGKSVRDCLLLVDPTCPELCLAAMHTPIYHYLCSITLCRDLHMFHPNMTHALLSHALLRCFEDWTETRSSACLKFALRIVYSINKSHPISQSSKELLSRWFNDWESITQSEKDACNHPVQLLLLLCQQANNLETSTAPVPLLNLCNEALSRFFKEQLYLKADAIALNSRHKAKDIALQHLQKLFGITVDNSPKPLDDVFAEEPPLVQIRSEAQAWAHVEDEAAERFLKSFGSDAKNLTEFVTRFCQPWIATFNFGLFLAPEHLGKPWSAWSAEMEAVGDVPDALLSQVETLMNQCDLSLEGQLNFKNLKDVCEAMVLQACLNYDSASRSGIVNLADVRDGDVLRSMIVDLRMGHYFQAMSGKKQLFADQIGDKTLADALSATDDEFLKLIGNHTHGHCKSVFWAFYKASKNDPKKARIFASKTNGCFTSKYNLTFDGQGQDSQPPADQVLNPID